jgi:nitroreductase
MNPKLQPLFARRSVRIFTGQPVDDSLVHDLLEAAMAAPSAVARDPWRFVVVRERPTLDALADGLPNGRMLSQAALAVAVCGELSAAHRCELSYLLQDCSAAAENILIGGVLLGLGTCWLGVHPRQERVAHVAEVLALPSGIVPVAIIAVGWPAEQPQARTRYDPQSVHDERW